MATGYGRLEQGYSDEYAEELIEASAAGRQARRQGKMLFNNPYEIPSLQREWDRAWLIEDRALRTGHD